MTDNPQGRFDVDPQEALIRALNLLEQGWVKGKLRGGSAGTSGGQDPRGVCIRGALQDALFTIFDEQLRSRVLKPAEMPLQMYNTFIREQAQSFSRRIEREFTNILRERLGEKFLGVEHFNDAHERTKAEVLTFMRNIIDEVQAEVHKKEAEIDVTLAVIEKGVDEGKDLAELNALIEHEQAVLVGVRALLPLRDRDETFHRNALHADTRHHD